MKINSQEVLLINNKKMKMNDVKSQTVPVVEPQETKPDATLNALNLQGQNNIAFQGAVMQGARKVAVATMMALATLGGSLATTSCEDNITQTVTVTIDEAFIQKLIDSIENGNAQQIALLQEILAAVQQGNALSAEQKDLLTLILAGTQQLDKNDKEGLALLNAILTAVNKSIVQGEELGKEYITLLNKIIANQDSFSAEFKAQMAELIAKIDQLDANVVKGFTAVVEKMDKMSEEQKTIASNILTAVLTNNEISATNSKLLALILDGIVKLDKNDKIGLELINKIWAKLEEYIQEDKDMDNKELLLLQSILDNIQNFNADVKTGFTALIDKLDQIDADVLKALKIVIENMENLKGTDGEKILAEILNAINKNNEISADNNKLLAIVVAKLGTLEQNDQKGFDLINKIWAELQKSIEYNEALDGKTHALLHAILDNVQNFNNDAKDMFAKLMAKLDTMDANNVAMLKVIADKFGDLDKLGQDALNKILNAIYQNSDIAQGTQDLVKELLGKVDKLGDKADKIIETIANIGVGEKVDLSKIESMLADLLAQEKANGQIFNNLDSKLGLIEVTLEALKKHEMANDPEVLKKLQAILDKIPAGCTCTHETLDITVIVDKLQQIIDKMGDDKNEGILGDLGNLDNILG